MQKDISAVLRGLIVAGLLGLGLGLHAAPEKRHAPALSVSHNRFQDNRLFLGMNSNMLWGKPYASALIATGARWVRLSQTGANIALKTQGKIDWTLADQAVAALDVPTGDSTPLNAIALIGGAPKWDSPDGKSAKAFKSIHEPWYFAKNVYGNYVFQMALLHKCASPI